MRSCLARSRATGRPPGRYQLLAAVNAVHTDAATAALALVGNAAERAHLHRRWDTLTD